LIAYDERHGYRGPLARVELPGAGAGAESQPPSAVDAEALRSLLDDYPTLLDYESAIVLAADAQSARVWFATHGEQSIARDAVEWARTLQATLGSGGRTLRVRTGDGSIRIE
jgi:penicillin-binding protein 1A